MLARLKLLALKIKKDLIRDPFGGAMRDRTADLMRAKHALSQLSYSPKLPRVDEALGVVRLPGLEPGTSSLSGMRSNRLSYNRPSTFLDSSVWPIVLSTDSATKFKFI